MILITVGTQKIKFDRMYEYIKFESISFKELIIYLTKFPLKANIKKITRKIKKIHFDPALINEYLSDLSVYKSSTSLVDEVYEFYSQIEDKKIQKSRKDFVDLLGTPNIILD